MAAAVGCTKGDKIYISNQSEFTLSRVIVRGKGFETQIRDISPGGAGEGRVLASEASSMEITMEIDGAPFYFGTCCKLTTDFRQSIAIFLDRDLKVRIIDSWPET